MVCDDEMQVFILPDGLEFPVIVRNPDTGKVRLDRLPRSEIEAANPGVDWRQKGIVLVYVMAWYELLRNEGFQDPVAEGIRAQMSAPLLKKCYRLLPGGRGVLRIH